MSFLWPRGGLRRLATDARAGTLGKWLHEWVAVPEVVFFEGMEPPTALSWLRRRGPPLPEAALHKLFRSSTVRQYDPVSGQVRRASKTRPLPAGATLLVPKSAIAAAQAGEGSSGGGGSGGSGGVSAGQRAALSPAAQRAADAWAARLRAGLLHRGRDFLAVNKPAGLACQGGRGVRHSVDAVAAAAFGGQPAELRLVHRLDRGTTGALLLAVGPDAAAWLAAAFCSGSAAGAGDDWRRRGGGGGSVGKLYWAVVALPRAGGALPRAGSVGLPVRGGKGGSGGEQAALTRYRVLHSGGGLAWLELRPVTGRKHQIRLHCAHGLGAPVLGDSRYGAQLSPAAAAALQAAVAAARGEADGPGGREPPLFLHCRQLAVTPPGAARRRVVVSAPLPAPWRALLARQGWPAPAD